MNAQPSTGNRQPSTGIDGKQIKLIHIAMSDLRLDDVTYRFMLYDQFKVRSSKQLSYDQASELINYFKRLGFRIQQGPRGQGAKGSSEPRTLSCTLCAPRPKRDAIPDNTIYLVSPQQLVKIEHLREDIRWHKHDGFERWLKKYFGLDKIKLSIEASAVIEGLKGLLRSQNKCKCTWNYEDKGPRAPGFEGSREE
jgi:hypothetical protein